MSYGPKQVFQVGTASGASTSSFIDFGDKSFGYLAIYAVTMSTGALVSLYGAASSNGTYSPIQIRVPNTATVAYQNLQIPTASSGSWITMEAPPFRYIQLITSAVVSGGVSYTVIGSD
jgi:hypothetical protein